MYMYVFLSPPHFQDLEPERVLQNSECQISASKVIFYFKEPMLLWIMSDFRTGAGKVPRHLKRLVMPESQGTLLEGQDGVRIRDTGRFGLVERTRMCTLYSLHFMPGSSCRCQVPASAGAGRQWP